VFQSHNHTYTVPILTHKKIKFRADKTNNAAGETASQPPRVKPALHNANREKLENGKKKGKEMKLETKVLI
jgi:hypothetical protein